MSFEKWFPYKAVAGQTARTIAHAYERLRLQHPGLSHNELLRTIVAERQANSCVATGWLKRLQDSMLGEPRARLGELVFQLVLTESNVSEASFGSENTSLLRNIIDEEIKGTLGYMPEASKIALLKSKSRDAFLKTEIGYRRYLKTTFGIGQPLGYPKAPWENAVLQTRREWQDAAEQVRRLGLPAHFQPEKNWDSLAALDCILRKTGKSASILDAGTELYSVILPSLFLYSYKNLIGINLVFDQSFRLGPIHYGHGDITQTRFKEKTFDAITCLSVVEHGVDLRAYFQEAARILRPNGVLITSTDYYATPIDTKGAIAYGVPIHIYTQAEIIAALDSAREFGLELTGPVNLECKDKAVRWEEFSLDYTFLIFTLQKKS